MKCTCNFSVSIYSGKHGKTGKHFPVGGSRGILTRLEKSERFSPNISQVWKILTILINMGNMEKKYHS